VYDGKNTRRAKRAADGSFVHGPLPHQAAQPAELPPSQERRRLIGQGQAQVGLTP